MSGPVLSVMQDGEYVPLPQPKYGGYSAVPVEYARTGVNIEGTSFRDRIAVKSNIAAEWACLSPAQRSQVISLTGSDEISLRYFDTATGTFRYGTFYRGDLDISPVQRFDGTDFIYYSIAMTLVEYRWSMRCPKAITIS